MAGSIFDKKASFRLGDITVTLSADPSKLGVRPERYRAVQLWLNECALAMEAAMDDEVAVGQFAFIKPKPKQEVKAAPVHDDE